MDIVNYLRQLFFIEEKVVEEEVYDEDTFFECGECEDIVVEQAKQDDDCDLCRMHGKDSCPLHAELRLSLDKEVYDDFRIFREDVFDPKRERDIFLDYCEEDRYKAIVDKGVWTLFYVGKKRETEIIDVDDGELGRLAFGRVVQRVCIVCVVVGRMSCPEHKYEGSSSG